MKEIEFSRSLQKAREITVQEVEDHFQPVKKRTLDDAQENYLYSAADKTGYETRQDSGASSSGYTQVPPFSDGDRHDTVAETFPLPSAVHPPGRAKPVQQAPEDVQQSADEDVHMVEA